MYELHYKKKIKIMKLKMKKMQEDQAVDEDGSMIGELMMVETKPINLNEAMKDSNWLVVMKLEFKYIEKNRTCEQ